MQKWPPQEQRHAVSSALDELSAYFHLFILISQDLVGVKYERVCCDLKKPPSLNGTNKKYVFQLQFVSKTTHT